MFKLTREEAESSRSQFAMLNDGSQNLESQNVISNEDFLRSQFATLDDDPEDLRSQNATSSSDDFLRSQFVTLNEKSDINGYKYPTATIVFPSHFCARNIFFR